MQPLVRFKPAADPQNARNSEMYVLVDGGVVRTVHSTGDRAICVHFPGVTVWEWDGQACLEIDHCVFQEIGQANANRGEPGYLDLPETDPRPANDTSIHIGSKAAQIVDWDEPATFQDSSVVNEGNGACDCHLAPRITTSLRLKRYQ